MPIEAARRLAIAKQHLSGPRSKRRGPRAIVDLVRDLGYVQWDPVPIVAPSHLLSIAARLGPFRPRDLERLLWTERRLLLQWIPIASIVRTEDYPILRALMDRYPASLSRSWGSQRASARRFLTTHRPLRRAVLAALAHGPRTSRELAASLGTRRNDGDWAPRSDAEEMLFHLSMSGEVLVIGHRGAENLWGRSGEYLPEWTPRTALSWAEFERTAAERTLRALGVATPREIQLHFLRGRYQQLPRTLEDLERAGTIHRISLTGRPDREVRFVHERDRESLEAMRSDPPEPRLALLPPFDNMLSNSDRNHRLFGFDYVREQFLPPARRRYGTYVLPILWGDRFVGRIDPRFDRPSGTLHVQAIHREPDAPADRRVGGELAASIAELARFVGARRLELPDRPPGEWRTALAESRAALGR